jgi:hypothetical protein
MLRNEMFGKVTLRVPGDIYKLNLWADDAGVVRRITLVHV